MVFLSKIHFSIVFISFLFLISACSTSNIISRKEQKNLHQQIANSPIFSKNFTGFQLYDPSSKTVLYEQYADKYFTPASNTKIFTFYAAATILGDSIPALRYHITGDSLIFWGTGDPSLFHFYLPDNQNVIRFLNNRKEQLFYCPDNFMATRYGTGWAWDDYPYYFQVERSAMPIYGNVILINGAKKSTNFTINPGHFTTKIISKPNFGGKTARFYRQEKNNFIDYNQNPVGKSELERELPFIYSDSLLHQLLLDSLNRPLQLITNYGMPPKESQTIYSLPSDSVYQRMMQVSDNFLAEQLILLCGNQLFDTLQTAKTIALLKDSLFSDSPDELLWFDGSGLSRYNQFTPRTIIQLLEKIYTQMPITRWQNIFPARGASGPFDNIGHPYIYAKTGSVRNVRCFSGFLLTRSGKTLLFSFMNNHIPGSSGPWNVEMDKVLRWVYEEL